MDFRQTAACIVVALICIFAGLITGHIDDEASYENCKAITKLAEIIGPTGKHYPADYPANAADDAACNPPPWYAVLKPAEVLLVFIGFGTMFVIAWQSWETRKSADASRRTLDLIIAKERPKITIYLEDFELALQFPFTHVEGPSGPEIDTRRHVHYAIHCDCPTGAVILRSGMEAYLRANEGIGAIEGTTGLATPSPIEGLRTTSGIQVLNLKTRVLAVFDRPLRHQIQVGLVTLACWGFIEYRGRHQREGDPPYRTAIKKRWVPNRNTSIPGYIELGYWEVEGSPEGNQQT